MVDWIFNTNLGGTREDIRARRDQRRKNKRRGNNKKPVDWSKSSRESGVAADEEPVAIVDGGDSAPEPQEKEKKNKKSKKKNRKGMRIDRNQAAHAQKKNQSSFSGF